MVRLRAIHIISIFLIIAIFLLSTALVYFYSGDLFGAVLFSFLNIIGATFPPNQSLVDTNSIFVLAAVFLGAIANISFTITFTTVFYQILSGVNIRYTLSKHGIKHATRFAIITPINGMGIELAKKLKEAKIDPVMIDENKTMVRHAMKDGFLAIHGDAANPEVLDEARISDALGLFSLYDDDVKNTFITIEARRMRRGLRVFTRIKRLDDIAKMERAGARRTMLPEAAVGIELSDFILANM